MSDPKTITEGNQQLSKLVYFVSTNGDPIRPIYQRDNNTGISSYRTYPNGGNTKNEQVSVRCYKELAQILIKGISVRCKAPDGASSNRSLNSSDVASLHIEILNI